MGAEPYACIENRTAYRNSYKGRTLKTRVGQIEFMIPQDREGNFRTGLSDRYQRNKKALVQELTTAAN